MAIGLNAGFVEIVSSKGMPVFQAFEDPTTSLPCSGSQPPWVAFEEIVHVAVELPEIIDKGWALVKENGSAQRLDGRTDEQFLNESVQVCVLNPMRAQIKSANISREQCRESISEVLQARTIEEADGMFPIQVVVPILGKGSVTCMGLWIDPRIVSIVDLHGLVWCVEELL